MKLAWDQVGERRYETGVDHGVLYLHDGRVEVWNGLTSVEESSDTEIKDYYLDGVKYLEVFTPGDFSGKLKAITYPEIFDSINGVVSLNPGFAYYNQPAKSFDLSYRTKKGNDLDGIDHGYKIHILYNVFANPDASTFNTIGESVEPVEFAWTLTGTPPVIKGVGIKPTVHVSLDSVTTPPDVLRILEAQLYGTDLSNASLPSLQEIAEYFGYVGALIVIDHRDGTWSAIDEADTYITMLDPTTFEIDNADATYLDADTYEIQSTNVD